MAWKAVWIENDQIDTRVERLDFEPCLHMLTMLKEIDRHEFDFTVDEAEHHWYRKERYAWDSGVVDNDDIPF